MDYKIKYGILHCGDVPVFALGASYYPSFLPSKYQVPEDGDRFGEMKKDLRKMKESGLNFFRTAALSELSADGSGDVQVKSDFIDSMVREAHKVGLASSVRLNGYFVNFSGNENFEFINQRGESLEKNWNAFMRGCFYHSGFVKDNIAATKALAEHFDKFPSVVSYQIYNEPHYPFNGVFDYHPDAVKMYKKQLVQDGVMTEDEIPIGLASHLNSETKRSTRTKFGKKVTKQQKNSEKIIAVESKDNVKVDDEYLDALIGDTDSYRVYLEQDDSQSKGGES